MAFMRPPWAWDMHSVSHMRHKTFVRPSFPFHSVFVKRELSSPPRSTGEVTAGAREDAFTFSQNRKDCVALCAHQRPF